jgi:RNA polymerase sigma factor for flagellar operon FliA
MNPPETSKRARAYARYKDEAPVGPDDTTELARRYGSLVHLWARRYAGTSSGVIDWEDLVSVGMMGLIQAHRRFDPSAGKPFEVYAEFRIKGAILDELRRVDPFSQPHRRKVRKLGTAIQQLTNELGREPQEAELALFLNLTLPQVRDLLNQAQALKFDGVEEIDRHALAKDIAVSGWSRTDLEIALSRAISLLDKRNQTILSLYYYEGLSMAEIADTLGVTEARISQLHSAAIKMLREAVATPAHGSAKAPVARVADRP